MWGMVSAEQTMWWYQAYIGRSMVHYLARAVKVILMADAG